MSSFHGAFRTRNFGEGPENGESGARSVQVCGIERNPIIAGIDNMAQMPFRVRQ